MANQTMEWASQLGGLVTVTLVYDDARQPFPDVRSVTCVNGAQSPVRWTVWQTPESQPVVVDVPANQTVSRNLPRDTYVFRVDEFGNLDPQFSTRFDGPAPARGA